MELFLKDLKCVSLKSIYVKKMQFYSVFESSHKASLGKNANLDDFYLFPRYHGKDLEVDDPFASLNFLNKAPESVKDFLIKILTSNDEVRRIELYKVRFYSIMDIIKMLDKKKPSDITKEDIAGWFNF